jgi:hypothetical protein
MNSSVAFNFSSPVKKFNWICDTMTETQEVTFSKPAAWFSVLITTEVKTDALFCKPTPSGRQVLSPQSTSSSHHDKCSHIASAKKHHNATVG